MNNQAPDIAVPRTIRKCGLIFTINDTLSDTKMVVYDWTNDIPFTSGRTGEAHKVEAYFDGQRAYSHAIIRDAIFNYQDDMVQAAYRDIITHLLDIRSNDAP